MNQRSDSDSPQRLIDVGEDVVDVLDADRKADELRGDATGDLLFGAELTVSRAGRMNGESLGITKVCEVGDEPEGVDEFCTLSCTTLDAEDNDGTSEPLEIALVLGELRVVFEARKTDPFDFRVRFKMFGDSE